MRKRFISLGCWVAGILIVAALYITVAALQLEWLVLVAMILAALDARWARVWRYESEIARAPGSLLLLMLTLGWLIMPWYVGLRLKILFGVAELKAEYRWAELKTPGLTPYPVSEEGLLQPWKRRK